MKFTVKDAGEVEIRRDGNQLVLIEARPSAGWEIDVEDEDEGDEDSDVEAEDEEGDDEGDGSAIEVAFTQDNREVEFEAALEDGRVAVEIEETWHDAEAGTFTVGEAGTVEVRRDGDRLILVGVIANEGWNFEAEREENEGEDEETSEEEIEVTFTSGNREVEFEATIEDGELEIEIETKWYEDEG
jgi:hypothetical protein